MTFAEAIAADLGSVFLNLDEHAEEIELDGRIITAILDRHEVESEGRPGVNVSEVEIHLKDEDLSPRPRVGDEVTLDGEKHTVQAVEPEAGLLTVVLMRNET
ncbi:MAG: hypothetical protein JRJ59_05540 [Deltaproteobacteria bacterium]|nr:hypothetical protein [Deltaproteobacteria bacterium]